MQKNINLIGVWIVRIGLVGSAIYCAISGKQEVAMFLGLGAFYSFIFLD